MIIEYDKSKDVECYRDFVTNPSDRKAMRAFSKTFGQNLMKPAKTLHDRLVSFASAGEYNAMYGSTDNRIEIMKGSRDNEPLVLKIRISRSHRKFFNHKIDNEGKLLLKQDWKGDFNSITTIYVFAVNKHDYNSI